MLNEVINIISPLYVGTFIDCTFGHGGYTKKILEYKDTKVIALDRDKEVLNKAIILKNKFQERFDFRNIKFSKLKNLDLKNNQTVRAIIFDLGYSQAQIEDQKKGLSFNSIGELNMRMGLNEFSAKEVINKLEQNELEKIFKFFGEEKESKKITKKIIEERKKNNITTEKLVEIIQKTKTKKNYKSHSATKIFQALRIFVNKEISELINGLVNATKILDKNGIMVVVTFHSLEDKIVKHFFKNLSENKNASRYLPKAPERKKILKLIKKKPIFPSKKEIKINPQSRSAKIRYAIKDENFVELKTDIFEKFKYLLDIENYSEKL